MADTSADAAAGRPPAAETLSGRAETVIAALQREDWEALAEVVHPERGVRFSPYAYVDTMHHVVLSRRAVAALGSDTTRYTWGAYDGSGKPIHLTADAYYEAFLYDKDFAQGTRGEPGQILQRGNTKGNIGEVYDGPGTTFIAYHVPGSGQHEGMDWASLRLVFQRQEGRWYLVGIVHDQWTI